MGKSCRGTEIKSGAVFYLDVRSKMKAWVNHEVSPFFLMNLFGVEFLIKISWLRSFREAYDFPKTAEIQIRGGSCCFGRCKQISCGPRA